MDMVGTKVGDVAVEAGRVLTGTRDKMRNMVSDTRESVTSTVIMASESANNILGKRIES